MGPSQRARRVTGLEAGHQKSSPLDETKAAIQPLTPNEELVARIWTSVLGVEAKRHENFFELGGSSLLALAVQDQLRREGVEVEISALFNSATLADLARSLRDYVAPAVPPNQIVSGRDHLTPEMLPLIGLSQEDIDRIIEQTPGGLSNIQDIYDLSPLQEGMLFHHMLNPEGDVFLLLSQMAFDRRDLLDRYLAAVQRVVDRHDILRTAFHWKGLSKPTQVVRREASLNVIELALDPNDGPISDQLWTRFDSIHNRIDLADAPLLRFAVAFDGEYQRWVLLQQLHHLIGDYSTLDVMNAEVRTLLGADSHDLAEPYPFRNFIAQVRQEGSPEHERFFQAMLGDVTKQTNPFGLENVHGAGADLVEARETLPGELSRALRDHAQRLGVSLASLCHLAWALVLARLSGEDNVVFGTVLFGRMHSGEAVQRALGMFINTLPIRLDMNLSLQAAVRHAHMTLADLIRHEHASLALAQRCSGLPPRTPVFSALLNFRQGVSPGFGLSPSSMPGITWLGGRERTNYPITLNVDDFGDAIDLAIQVSPPHSAESINGYVRRALTSLSQALQHGEDPLLSELEVLPSSQHGLALETAADTQHTLRPREDKQPRPAGQRPSDDPQGPLEEALANFWMDLLLVDRIGRDDNFFERGGDSIGAMRTVIWLSTKFSVNIPLDTFFLGPSISKLSEAILAKVISASTKVE